MKLLEIKACRVRQGISVHEAAQAIDVTDDAYRKKERGDTKFSPSEIPILANLFAMTAAEVNDYFFNGELPNG